MRTQNIYLEHANITVNDLQKAIHFFQTAFPHFKIRGGGGDGYETRKWVHLGDEDTYIAINQARQNDIKVDNNYDSIGINHLGFVVQDVEEITNNLLSNGYKRDYPKQIEQFRIRDYFTDADGNQYEFIQYLSDVVNEKNSY
ncbi:VOC family protein [Dokdonia sp.]|uniref:VOC family protein n=1 Tax=Dokdonia sp. TaxID=2024995 RepID=UPI003263D379